MEREPFIIFLSLLRMVFAHYFMQVTWINWNCQFNKERKENNHKNFTVLQSKKHGLLDTTEN